MGTLTLTSGKVPVSLLRAVLPDCDPKFHTKFLFALFNLPLCCPKPKASRVKSLPRNSTPNLNIYSCPLLSAGSSCGPGCQSPKTPNSLCIGEPVHVSLHA